MKGLQEALGIEAPSHMKGLQVFIADIRNCPNKEQEEKRVEKELAKIRQKFQNPKLSGYDKKKYVWKLLYAYMLGYDIDFGHFQAVELCSSPKFSEKTAGYLAISLLLSDNAEIVRLVVNSVKNDMNSNNEHIACLALNTVANIGGAEFADNLFTDISKMLLAPQPSCPANVKRKACICLLRLYRKDQDTLHPEVWRKKLAALFFDRDVGLLTSVSGFMLAILEQGTFPVMEWSEILPAVTQCLHQMVNGECPEHYEYYHVPAPWLQTKLLRIEQFFPLQCFDNETLPRVNAILHSILTKPAAQRAPQMSGAGSKKRCKADAERQNRSNAEHSILFEAMNLMIHLEDRCEQETTRTAAGLLGAFISSTDPNIRYLGLETMARLATNVNTHEHLERYKNLILEKMHEPDISIRRQALNLLYALCRRENWQQIVDELLEILGASDAQLQEELVLKIAILAEKYSPNFKLYVDVVFKMLESAPESVGDDVWYRVVQVVTGFEDQKGSEDNEKKELQRHAAKKSFDTLSQRFPHETLVKLGAYMVGEFGYQLPRGIPAHHKFEALSRHYHRGSPAVKAIILMAVTKLLNDNTDLRHEVRGMLEDLMEAQDVELQQRACELTLLSERNNEDLLDQVLFPMPQYAETVQQNNPLVQRLKFQTRSRAHTRAQLEEAAKSEGGVYKMGMASGRLASGGDSGRASDMNLPGNFGGAGSSRPGHGDSTDDDTGSGEDSEDDFDPRRMAEAFQELCIRPQGRWMVHGGLTLDLKHEYRADSGQLTVTFTNSGRDQITNIRVAIQPVPAFKTQVVGGPPGALAPRSQGQHLFQVWCLRPFEEPPLYRVEYTEGSRNQMQDVRIPAISTKFITPEEMPVPQFRTFFDKAAPQPAESQIIAQAKVNPNMWPDYLGKGFNLFVLPGSTPTETFAAGTWHTATQGPDGKMLTCPIMVILEYNAERQQVRLRVRTMNPQHGEVCHSIGKVIATHLLIPPSRQNGT